MKTLKRKTMFVDDTDAKMHTIYEYDGKMGTTSRTKFWFTEIPTKNATIYGVCEEDRETPYKNGHAFQYAHWCLFHIDDIGDLYGDGVPFVYATKVR